MRSYLNGDTWDTWYHTGSKIEKFCMAFVTVKKVNIRLISTIFLNEKKTINENMPLS